MLSVDAYYPDCTACGTSVFVQKDAADKTFRCAKCGRNWTDEEFDAVFSLPQEKATLYIQRKYAGASYRTLSSGRYGDPRYVKGVYHDICEQLNVGKATKVKHR